MARRPSRARRRKTLQWTPLSGRQSSWPNRLPLIRTGALRCTVPRRDCCANFCLHAFTCNPHLVHLVRVALSRADRTQSGTASWTRNSLNRLSRRPRSPQISKPMIKHQCRVGRIRPATRKAKKKRGSLQRLWHRVRDPCCTIACAVLSLPSAVSTLRPADNPCSLMTFVDFC